MTKSLTPPPPPPPLSQKQPDSRTSALNLLIYAFLLHNNYGQTAEAFSKSCGLVSLGILSPGSSPRYLVRLAAEDVGEDIVDSDEKATSMHGKEEMGEGKDVSMQDEIVGSMKAETTNGGSASTPGMTENELIQWRIRLFEQHLEYLHVRQSKFT